MYIKKTYAVKYSPLYEINRRIQNSFAKQGASGKSVAPNNTKTISHKAWSTPADNARW